MRPERGVEIGSQWYRGKGFRYDGNRKNLLGMLLSHARASQTGIANHGFGTYKHCCVTAGKFTQVAHGKPNAWPHPTPQSN